MARALTLRALAILFALALGSQARAQCESELPRSDDYIDPSYGPDANANWVPDRIEQQCPVDALHPDQLRNPGCYLAPQLVPDDYVFVDENSLGGFWQRNGCVPAIAYPIDDSVLGLGRGVVIVGAPLETAHFVREAIAAGRGSWKAAFAPDSRPLDAPPKPSQATCLVSFDYALSNAVPVVITSAAIANFYVHYCTGGNCDPFRGTQPLWPSEGLGIARSVGIEPLWHTRLPTFAMESVRLERMAFGRGVLYSHAFGDPSRGCSEARASSVELSAIDAFDPTAGPPRFKRALRCSESDAGSDSDSELPSGLTLLPPRLDAALRADAVERAKSNMGTPTCLLEGLPEGLIADELAGPSASSTAPENALRDAYLLPNRALLAQTTGEKSSFVVVPEPIAFLDQNLVLVSRTPSFVVASLRPIGAVERADKLHAGSAIARRATQRFEIEPNAERTIETLESISFASALWPPHASTFDKSERYGTRWTSNDGAPDCFATTTFDSASDRWLRFGYPLGSGASGTLAKDFCPNELDGWLVRTRETRGGAQSICSVADDAMKSKAQLDAVVKALQECLALAQRADAGTALGAAGAGASAECREPNLASANECLRSGCNPLVPETCPRSPACAGLVEGLLAPSSPLQNCIAEHALAQAEALLPASKHWADVMDGDRMQLVAMVAMLRTNALGENEDETEPENDAGCEAKPRPASPKPEWPTTISQMTNQDAFFGGAHQTLDWNWIVKSDSTDAIDPAYRGIAVNDSHFIKIENELEFGVPRGLWDTHVRLPDCFHFNTHGREFLSFLQSEKSVEGLAQIWPNDFCEQFGIDRHPGGPDNPSWPMSGCDPCVACAAATAAGGDEDAGVTAGCHVGQRYYRTHFGRGLFSPIAPETVRGDDAQETAFMAVDSNWPGCTNAPRTLEANDRLPLGADDWKACPHRLAYLGRPVLDCGHTDDKCDSQHRLEIHPPHVLTLELHQKAFGQKCTPSANPCELSPQPGCTTGTVSAAFGWANEMVGPTFEFDLWPPPRPSPASVLCTVGADCGQKAKGEKLSPVTDFGYRVQKSALPVLCSDEIVTEPSLSCQPAPPNDPNHLHCVYTDFRSGRCTNPDAQATVNGVTFGNPRMTPRFATSIFEARIFVGWSSDGALCPSCDCGDESCSD